MAAFFVAEGLYVVLMPSFMFGEASGGRIPHP